MLADHKSVSLEGEAMKKYISFAIGALLLASGVTLSDQVLAERGYGSHGGRGMHHGSMRGKHWKSSLTDQQRSQINKLRLNYKKKKYMQKAKKKQAKVELALLVTSNSPNMTTINKKIDQIVAIKRQILRMKYSYKVKKRKILTPDQRVMFDMRIMKKAYRGKRRCRFH